MTSLLKQNDDWTGSLAAVTWLQDNYAGQTYCITSHPSRALKWTVGQFRAFNDAAPDVAFGFCGIPGSQKELPMRGGYDADDIYVVSKKTKKDDRGHRLGPHPPRGDGPTAAPTTWSPRSAASGTRSWARVVSGGCSATPTSTRPMRSSGPGEYSKDYTWVEDFSA